MTTTTLSAALVVCCMCGITIPSNSVNTCAQCLQSRHDVTEHVERAVVLIQCRRCTRWQREDGSWGVCEPESKNLLSHCLRKVTGLKRVRLIDAEFVWTEPHSRRIKIKLKVQDEVERGVILQQSCVTEFVVKPQMCLDCHRTESSQTWISVVQVRQKVHHKRTFLFLEQLILKHKAQERAVRIDPQPEGVDFYFANKTDGARFVSFLDSAVPMRFKQAEKLISADVKSNDSTYNYSFMVELSPICKDDLVVLPLATASKHGSVAQLALCLNVASTMRFIDYETCRLCELSSTAYWQAPFTPVLDASSLINFVVLDVRRIEYVETTATNQALLEAHLEAEDEQEQEEKGSQLGGQQQRKRRRKAPQLPGSAPVPRNLSNKHSLCEVEVAREKDLGVNDQRFIVKSHLGNLLRAGDIALGYDLSTSNYNHQEADKLVLPDVILVRKHFPKLRGRNRKRVWKLKSIAAEAPDRPGLGVGVDEERHAGDMELFMRDVEEDAEMRSKIKLYKQTDLGLGGAGLPSALKSSSARSKAAVAKDKKLASAAEKKMDVEVLSGDEGDEIEEDAPHVPEEEMLDEMASDQDDDNESL